MWTNPTRSMSYITCVIREIQIKMLGKITKNWTQKFCEEYGLTNYEESNFDNLYFYKKFFLLKSEWHFNYGKSEEGQSCRVDQIFEFLQELPVNSIHTRKLSLMLALIVKTQKVGIFKCTAANPMRIIFPEKSEQTSS